MDAHTLVVMNVFLYVLYAGVILANARVTGMAKGARWFAGANLSRGGALLVFLMSGWAPARLPIFEAVCALLSVLGIMMLHFSFVDLLGRTTPQRSLQYVLVAMMLGVTVYVLSFPSRYPAELLAACATEAIQVAGTASVVFLFSGEEMGPAAWLTGVALSLYSLLLLARVGVILRFDHADYPQLSREMTRFWLMTCLVTNSMIAFGFMFISAAKLRVELLWHAQVDELTGLLNRWALTRIAQREMSRSGRTKIPVAVVMMDLDGLKAVNDALGHGGGDVVLQAVAGVLRETVRGPDSVARIGGDEFCILLPDTGLAEALVVTERMRSRVEALVLEYRGQTVRVRASMGVASSESCGLSWKNLIEQSDAALYRAKRGGRNKVATTELEALGESGPLLD